MRTAAEIAIGVIFCVGAVFNALYTRRGHGPRFYGGWAEGAWASGAGTFIRKLVIPNSTLFTSLIIAFQAAVGIAILTRGALVVPALLAGGGFAVVVAYFSNPGGTAGNLVLAVIQFALVVGR